MGAFRRSFALRGARWRDALTAALQGTPSVCAIHHSTSSSTNDALYNRDAKVLHGVEAVLEVHVPTQQFEALDPRRLAFVRRCRWALLPYASPEARAACLEAFLVRYLQAAQSCMYDVVDGVTRNSATTTTSIDVSEEQSPLEANAKMCIIEAIEAFSEASVMKIPVDERHYRPFLSFSGMVQLDPDIIENLLLEYDASVKRASTNDADERTNRQQQQHVVNDGTEDLRCIAASSYAAAGYSRRAVSIARPEHLPAVIENTVKVRRSGWMAALQMASCIQSISTPLTTTTKWSLRDGTRSGSMAPLIAVCSAMDWACRAQPTRMYFDTMLPSVAATVVSWATAQNHVHSSDPLVRLTDRAEVEMLMSKLTRVAQPQAHWQEVLLVFKEYVKGAAAGGTGAPVAETAVAETAVGEGSERNAINTPQGEAGVNRSAGYHQRQGDDTKDSSSSSTPTGRVMHVLLLADRWQEALQVFEHTPHKMRNAHTSSRNYLLTAISKKLAAGAEEMLSALSTSPPPHNLPECALADIVERDYNTLRDAYVSQQPKNHFTHVTFVRALCECTHLVGCGSDEIQHALRALQHSPRARRCAEDTALHASFGGSWQTAVFLYMLQGDAQHSRYLGPIAIAACAQQYHEQQCAMLLTHLCSRSPQSLSRKQLTLCCAAMVACGVWGQATPSSNTSHPASGASKTALELTSVLTDAIRRHQLIGSQEDYDAFAAQFLEYLSSAVLHRSRAAEISHESCPSTLQRHADESEDARQRRVAGEKDRAWRAMCIAATRRRRTAEAITNPEHLMGNLMALLEVPPKLSHIAATAELRSTYRHKADYYSGSMSVGWIAALQILNAAAQVGGKGDGGDETSSWSTASLPTLLMDLGFHQNTVMACL